MLAQPFVGENHSWVLSEEAKARFAKRVGEKIGRKVEWTTEMEEALRPIARQAHKSRREVEADVEDAVSYMGTSIAGRIARREAFEACMRPAPPRHAVVHSQMDAAEKEIERKLPKSSSYFASYLAEQVKYRRPSGRS